MLKETISNKLLMLFLSSVMSYIVFVENDSQLDIFNRKSSVYFMKNIFYCIPVKNFSKKTLKNTLQKIKALFLRKENVPKTMKSVPKWSDLERILLPLKRLLGRSEMERSRAYPAGFETLSICFRTFSLLSNKLHLWVRS